MNRKPAKLIQRATTFQPAFTRGHNNSYLVHIIGVQACCWQPKAHVFVAEREFGIRLEFVDLPRLELAGEAFVGTPE